MKTLYYRGLLSSCNYRCGYCSFKTRRRLVDAEADAEALFRFCQWVHKTGAENVMFVPFGEAMIYPYYWEAMANLAATVSRVGCQTNLSFSVKSFVNQVSPFREKVRLWCSFHPSQILWPDFAAECAHLLESGIIFSVGAVGDPRNITALQKLREQLPPEVYFWINAIKGYRYTQDDYNDFLTIDPMFPIETTLLPAEPAKCTGGRCSLFIEGDGSAFACPISRIRLGNIFKDAPLRTTTLCKADTCNCYLAYVNRTDTALSALLVEERVFRVPNKSASMMYDRFPT